LKQNKYLIIFIIVGLTIQLFWEGLLWSNVIIHPKTSRPTDFSIFYTAGRLANAGQYTHLYDIQAQLRVQGLLLNLSLRPDELLPYNHPPLLVPILQIVCTPDYLASYWRWTLVMVCLLGVTAYLIDKLLRGIKVGGGSRFLIILAALSFYPVFTSLLKGQDTAFLLLAGMLWLYGMINKKDSIAGLGLAMMVIRPQIAIILAVPFLFNRRGVWWWFCAGGAVLSLYSLALVGFTGIRDFVNLLFISASGQGFGMNQNAMFNFTGMMLRLFPSLNVGVIHDLAWGLFLAAAVGLSILWKIIKEIRLRHLVLAVCLSLFAAPHLHYHDLAFLLVPLIGVVLTTGDRKWLWGSVSPAVMLVVASLVLLFADFWDPMRFTVPYLLMLVLPLLAWWLEKRIDALRVIAIHQQDNIDGNKGIF